MRLMTDQAGAKKFLEFLPLGGADEVGRSCYLVGDGERYVMLDCGTSPKKDQIPNFEPLKGKKLLAVLITHSHRDHIGALPWLLEKNKNLKIFSTPLTKELSYIILKDAVRVRRRRGEPSPPLPPENVWETREYGEAFQIDDGISAVFRDAGHIPGSAQIVLNWDGATILYTGDICTFDTRMGGNFEKWEEADVVISESTYGAEFSRPDATTSIISAENSLIEEMKNVLQQKGRILIPVFATGRAQEIMYVIASAMREGKLPRVPCYSIGMMNHMLDVIGKDPAYREKVATIWECFTRIDFPRGVDANPEADERFRKIRDSKKPSIFVATPGTLQEGASSNLAIKIFDEKRSAIFIVGYQDEDWPGWHLWKMEEGGKFRIGESELTVKCRVKKFEIRGHAHPKHIIENIKRARPKLVLFVHGDPKARHQMHRYSRLEIKKCRFLSHLGETRVRFKVRTGKYDLSPLPGAPPTES